jgi:hypothetical protein
MPCYPSSSCAPQGVARSQTVRQGVFANMSRWFARQVPRHVFAGGLMKVQANCPPCHPRRGWPWTHQEACRHHDETARCGCPKMPPMIDCLHAKTGSRSGPGCYCPPCHQDAANFGANLFIYHDIVWRSRAGFFFQVLRELIYTPDFFVYTMRVARVYTCVCICLHIYTPSYWVCMCVCVCMFTCTHTDLHVWVYVCAYICMPMGVCIFLY